MNAFEAYHKVQKAANILAWGWMLNNLLGLISIIVLIYVIWWVFHLGIIGVLVLLFGIWLINLVILPSIFAVVNKPLAEMAKSGAVRLGVLGVIDDKTVQKLANEKVEYWPRVIALSMTEDDFQRRILNSEN